MLLEPGDNVRYVGLGTGRVIRHDQRRFKGHERMFAVIQFPHRDMTVQLPIGDPKVAARLAKPLGEKDCVALLRVVGGRGKPLSRTWDQREELGLGVLRTGGPADWAALLASYATARANGLSVASSDADIVRSALEMLASELCASAGVEYADAYAQVAGAYHRDPDAGRAAA